LGRQFQGTGHRQADPGCRATAKAEPMASS
jgi:hypothetical protein